MLQHLVLLPTFLIVELSSNCMSKIIFPFDYGCIRSTLCTQFYIMIDVPVIILPWWLKMTLLGCILMMCVLVRNYTTFQDFCTVTLMAGFLQFLKIVHLEFITTCKQCEIYMKSIFVLRLIVNESEE